MQWFAFYAIVTVSVAYIWWDFAQTLLQVDRERRQRRDRR